MNTERTVRDCCPTCAEACEMTGYDGTVLKQPWIGVPVRHLHQDDIVRSFGAGDPIHVFGTIIRRGKMVFVQWSDRDEKERLQGGLVLRLRHKGEIVSDLTEDPDACSGMFQVYELRKLGYDARCNCTNDGLCGVTVDLTIPQAIFLQGVSISSKPGRVA